MVHVDHHDQNLAVINRVNHAAIPHSHSPSIATFGFFAVSWKRFVRQRFNFLDNPFRRCKWKSEDLFPIAFAIRAS